MSSQTPSSADLARRHIDNADVAGRYVFFRTDLNVPMAGGVITDTSRIDRIAPGIAALADRGARVVAASHYGRPKGKRVPELSLAPIAPALAEAVGRSVAFVGDCIGADVDAAIAAMADGDVLLLENLRFHPGEENNDEAFSAALAKSMDLYVNDAFAVSHRDHASVSMLARNLPAHLGPLMAEELSALAAALGEPEKPVAAIVGGAKVSTKLVVLENLISKVDILIIGGGMANTFLVAGGHDIGASLAETEMASQARQIMEAAGIAGCRIILPEDVVLAREFKPGAPHRIAAVGARIEGDEMILDAGPASVAAAESALDEARTLVWNGPMGAFEAEPFDAATTALARHAAALTETKGLISVAGGGDTVAALSQAGVEGDFHYVSTAGGAFLEWMEGRTLPGVAALMAPPKN
jgi:phosphoglycerate kinase